MENKPTLGTGGFMVICFVIVMLFLSCNKEDTPNFYDLDFRTGIWVNAELQDTLEFVNASELIRKGNPYSYQQYIYEINGNNLVVHIPGDENIKTYHTILKTQKNSVTLDNMYISIIDDNSGTFIKE